MELLKSLFLVSFITFVSSEELHSDGDAFKSILTTLSPNSTKTSLRLQDVGLILSKLGIHRCSNATEHKCVTSETLFKIFNISTSSSVNETEFSKFAQIMIYALLPNEEHSGEHDDDHDHDDHDDHDDDKDDDDKHDENDEDHDDDDDDDDREITKNIDVDKELMERYGTQNFCEQIVDQLLKDVNKTIGKQLSHGEKKCFSSDDIFHQLNISSDDDDSKSHLPEISVIIISRLISRQCIYVRYQSSLPCSSYFVNQLFQEYAENNAISEKKFKELLKKLKIGGPDEESHDEKEGHDNHRHRRRRSINDLSYPIRSQISGNSAIRKGRYRRETAHNDTTDNHGSKKPKMYQKCFTVDEFFAIYQIKNKTKGFDMTKFQSVSSALLQQIESDVCIKAGHPHDEKDVADKHKWGYGMLAVAIISFCSILGVAIIPFMEKIFYQKAVMFLISLAVGTLVGDALLHLFPHALGFHANHDHSHGSESTGESEDRDYLWKFLLATAAIYVFFIFETITHLFLRKSIGQSHSMEHTRRHKQINSHDHDHNVTEVAAVESGYSHKNPGVASMNMGYVNSGGPDEFGKSQNVKDENVPKTSEIREEGEVKKTISAVAWNIIIGDTIHNVADGIAIGVAFSDSIAGGISTSIAVFCHELPHELGDFAVLLTAGMSVKKALLANFISACFCFVGLVMGILISDVSEDINLWIFAATGGFFIYIALTNMLPELMHSAEFNAVSCFSRFLFQNLGILTGFAIMFLLSYFEEDINIE